MIIINPHGSPVLFPFYSEIISARMKEFLISEYEDVNNIISYIIENSGKMIRPRLVLLSSGFFPCDEKIVRDVAVAVEMIHMASLVHDDIIDRSMLRRGKRSLNAEWGNQVSVLTGDYLFAAAFQIINNYELTRILKIVTKTIRTMCAGEIMQMSMAYRTDMTEEQYLKKTFAKTACLFAASCKAGALTSAMPAEAVTNMENFGINLGYAYQIMDDVLDYVSDASLLGKPAGNDLTQGNVTLPVLHALQQPEAGAWLRDVIETRNINDQALLQIKRILIECGSIDYAVSRSRRFLAEALKNLHYLPSGLIRNELEALAWYLMDEYFNQLQAGNPVIKQEAVESGRTLQ